MSVPDRDPHRQQAKMTVRAGHCFKAGRADGGRRADKDVHSLQNGRDNGGRQAATYGHSLGISMMESYLVGPTMAAMGALMVLSYFVFFARHASAGQGSENRDMLIAKVFKPCW